MARFVYFLLAPILCSFINATLAQDGFDSMYHLTFHARHENQIMNQLYAAFNGNEDSYPALVHLVISGPLPKPFEDKTYEGNQYTIREYLSLRGTLKLGYTDAKTGKHHPPPKELHGASLQLLYKRFHMLEEAILGASIAGEEGKMTSCRKMSVNCSLQPPWTFNT